MNTVQNRTSKYDDPFKNVEMNTSGKKDGMMRNDGLGESTMSFGNIRRTNSRGMEDDDEPGTPVEKEGTVFGPN